MILVFIASLTLVAFLPTFLLLLRRCITTSTVRAGRNQGVKAYWFRWVLLSLQAATAIILMQLMIMLCVLFYHEALADRGFKRNQLLVSTFADPNYQPDKDTLEKQLQAKVADLSTGLALSSSIPGSRSPIFAPFEIPEVKLDSQAAELFQVSPSFFPVMDIKIVAGRGFSELDVKEGSPVFIVDEATARKIWPDDSAIGQPIILFPTIPFLRKQGTVVGIASEIRSNPYRFPVLYQPLSQGMANIHELQVITGANEIKPLTNRLAALSDTDDGFAKAETIETVLARNGDMTLDRIFNFLPACLLIMLMLLVSIRNTTLRILEDYRRPLAALLRS